MSKEFTKDELKDIVKEVLKEKEKEYYDNVFVNMEVKNQRLKEIELKELLKENNNKGVVVITKGLKENTNSTTVYHVTARAIIDIDYIDKFADENKIARQRLMRLCKIYKNTIDNNPMCIDIQAYNNKPGLTVQEPDIIYTDKITDEVISEYNKRKIRQLIKELELEDFAIIEEAFKPKTNSIEYTLRLKICDTGIEEVKIWLLTKLDS